MPKESKDIFDLINFLTCILITEGAGVIGSLATFSSVNSWYSADLVKPSFTPPSWVFGPVWMFLYFIIGWSLYLVWVKKNDFFWFWFQLFLNIAWSFIFFGFHLPWFAFVEIIILWLSIIKTFFEFYIIDKRAGILLLPYLAWVSFAAFLNFSIAILN